MARPLQIISTGGGDGVGTTTCEQEFALERDNLRSIIDKVPKGSKIAVVSVVGGFRTGKSFLLTLLLRYLKHGSSSEPGSDWMLRDGETLTEGNCNRTTTSGTAGDNGGDESKSGASFAWRGGHDRMTTGIWMWSEPFMHKSQDSGETIAVLLMDTQGMFDNETTMTLTAQIFGISTLISSLQIYNIQNRISEDHLQHLALFSEYGRIAHQQQRGDEKVSEDTQSWFSSSAPKPFQRLQFLVRDWANFDEAWPEIGPDEAGANPEGARARQTQSYNKLREEMQTYLTKLIKTRGDASLQSTRDQIARCFERVDCFLLPHPGIPVTKPNYDGSLKALDQGFRGLLDQFARLVFDEQLEPKRVQKRYITGIELANYFEAYVKLFQSGEGFPKAMTILEATAEANNRNAYDLAVNKYTEVMGPITGKGANETFLREAELRAKHKNAEEQALAVFADIATMGSPDGARIMQDLLVKFFVAEIDQRLNVNSLRNPFKDYEKYVIPAVVAIVSWILSVLLNATCSTTICKKLERNFVGVYVLFLIFVAFAMRNKLQTIFAYLRLLGAELGIGEKLKAS